jgi:hypothetical protein
MLEVDNRVILPELTHVRFIITAGDVIHSFACPSLGIKCDAYPGKNGIENPYYINMPGSGREYYYLPHVKPSNCGKALKLFQPSKSGNTSYGSGNDSRYGKIEIDARKEIGNPQPSTTIKRERIPIVSANVRFITC